MPFAHQFVHVDATRRSLTLDPPEGVAHTAYLWDPGVDPGHKPRFMRLRRSSEDISDAEEKLFVPIQARINEKVTYDVPDPGFVDVPLNPDLASGSSGAIRRRPGLFARTLQRTLSAPPMLGPRRSSLDMDSSRVKVAPGSEGCDGPPYPRSRSASIVDSLLFEIYDKLNFGRRFSGDSDTFTECSAMSEGRVRLGNSGPAGDCDKPKVTNGTGRRFKKSNLGNKGLSDLQYVLRQYRINVSYVANELVRQLKRRDRFLTKRDRSYDIITAILQAASLKRRVTSPGSPKVRVNFSAKIDGGSMSGGGGGAAVASISTSVAPASSTRHGVQRFAVQHLDRHNRPSTAWPTSHVDVTATERIRKGHRGSDPGLAEVECARRRGSQRAEVHEAQAKLG